jgi:predicted alpha/beta hydrolase family esterase
MAHDVRVLLVPGLWNSGPENWQSYWERERGDCLRVVQSDWETPRRQDWVPTLEKAIASAPHPVVLAAHSLGCSLVAHWAGSPGATLRNVHAALLVAPSDVEAPSYPKGPRGFEPMPRRALPFPTLVVASSDDPFVSLPRAREFAQAWGARLVDAGPLGHINADSRLGSWAQGQALLAELLAPG